MIVPDLRRKFRTLIDHGAFASLAAIAAAIGKKEGTINWWADGSDARARDTVPDASTEAVLIVLTRPLLDHWSEAEARDFALGTAGDYALAVQAGANRSLAEIIEAEADRQTARLFRQSGRGLVEVEEAPENAQIPTVRLGEWFRLEFDRKFAGENALALQQAQQAWGFISHARDPHRSVCLVPGLRDEAAAFMRERRDLGVNRFIVLESVAPVPADITQFTRAGVTAGKSALARIAQFFENTPRHRRHLHLIDVRVEASQED